jgi:hypothetical protein
LPLLSLPTAFAILERWYFWRARSAVSSICSLANRLQASLGVGRYERAAGWDSCFLFAYRADFWYFCKRGSAVAQLAFVPPPTSHPLSQKGPFVSVLFVQSVRVLPVLQPSNLFIKFTPRKRDPGQKNPKPIDHFTRTSTSRHQCGSLYAFVHPSVVFLSVPLLSFGSSSNPNR